MTSAKVILWMSVVTGFGWFSYFAVPVALTNTMLLAQGIAPEWTFKDMANLGGFATFAAAMYFLHRESIKTFREELQSERSTRAQHFDKVSAHLTTNTEGVNRNTSAIDHLSDRIEGVLREKK